MSRRQTAVLLNVLIMTSSFTGLLLALHRGWSLLYFYTQDSNFLAIIASGIYLARHRTDPHKARLWRYAAFICLNVTFLVVVFVLIPMTGMARSMLFGGSMFFHHTVTPLVSFFSFLFFEDNAELSRHDLMYGTVPTLVYGIIMIILNILKVTEGPYPFLMVYRQPVWASVLWIAGILGFTALMAECFRRFSNSRFQKE